MACLCVCVCLYVRCAWSLRHCRVVEACRRPLETSVCCWFLLCFVVFLVGCSWLFGFVLFLLAVLWLTACIDWSECFTCSSFIFS